MASTCIERMPKKCATRKSPSMVDHPANGKPAVSLATLPTQ